MRRSHIAFWSTVLLGLIAVAQKVVGDHDSNSFSSALTFNPSKGRQITHVGPFGFAVEQDYNNLNYFGPISGDGEWKPRQMTLVGDYTWQITVPLDANNPYLFVNVLSTSKALRAVGGRLKSCGLATRRT